MQEINQQHGPWFIKSRAWVYRDPWVAVQRDEVTRPDGQPGTYAVVHIKPGVCVLALDEKNDAHLTREFHYAVGETTLECVSGGRDNDEPALQAAQRELREELGLEAGEWIDLGRLDPFTASILSPTQLFLARKLKQFEKAPEGTEQIEHIVLPFEQVVEQVMAGKITHAPSMALILKVARFLVK